MKTLKTLRTVAEVLAGLTLVAVVVTGAVSLGSAALLPLTLVVLRAAARKSPPARRNLGPIAGWTE